jgi:predicted nucleic acid-binding protein
LPSFVDSSALLKLYIPEPGAVWMTQTVRPGGIAVSDLAITEIGVTLTRLARMGLLPEREARDTWKLFRRDVRGFLIYRLDRAALVGAANIAARIAMPLRSLDALQLRGSIEAAADARRARQAPPTFVSADDRLLRAAASLGFATDNPLDHV